MPRINRDTIRRDAEEAERALQEFAAAQPTAVVTPAANEPTPSDPAPVPAPTPVAEVVTPAAPTPTPTPVVAVPADEHTLSVLQHRLNTLEGMHNRVVADRDQAQRDLAEMRGRVDTMSRLLAQRNAPAPAPAAPQSLITETERREYGDELIGLMTRSAQEALLPMINSLIGRIDKLERGVRDVTSVAQTAAETSQQTAAQRFAEDLTRLVPDWETTNENVEFLDWLKKRDTLSGQVRYELLQQALGTGSAERVAKFFTAFKSEQASVPGAPAPSAAQTNPATPAPVAPAPQPAPFDPRSLVSPSQAAPAPVSGSPTNGKVWTTDEIAEVYDRHMKKQISPADFAALEGQIYKALEEGRVRE